MLVKIEDIKIKDRIRKDLGNLEDLKDSLRTYGLLNPVTINSNILSELTEVQELEIELEENNQRKEFLNDELLEGYKRLEKLKNPGFWDKFFKAIKNFFKKIKSLFQKK